MAIKKLKIKNYFFKKFLEPNISFFCLAIIFIIMIWGNSDFSYSWKDFLYSLKMSTFILFLGGVFSVYLFINRKDKEQIKADSTSIKIFTFIFLLYLILVPSIWLIIIFLAGVPFGVYILPEKNKKEIQNTKLGNFFYFIFSPIVFFLVLIYYFFSVSFVNLY